MKKLFGIGLLLCAFSTGLLAEEESGVTFIPSIGFQMKRLDFSMAYTATNGKSAGDAQFKADIPVLNTSLTAAYKKFFLTLKYDQTIEEAKAGTRETPPSAGKIYWLEPPGSELGVERTDINVTAGANVWDRLNVFAGYQDGKTRLNPGNDCLLENTGFFAITCIYYNLASFRLLGNGLSAGYEQTYSEKGPYLGASYALPIADAGVLSFSAAYAKMDGKYEDNFGLLSGANANMLFEGDSNGSSLGLTWTSSFTDRTAYFLDLRRQKYTMEASNKNTTILLSTLDTDEIITSFTAGLQFYF